MTYWHFFKKLVDVYNYRWTLVARITKDNCQENIPKNNSDLKTKMHYNIYIVVNIDN